MRYFYFGQTPKSQYHPVSGSFPAAPHRKNFEIHKVFLQFFLPDLQKNLSLPERYCLFCVCLFGGISMQKTKRLTESAMLIAIAVVLELAGRTVIPPMPFGGQLTLCAMLPMVLISWRHGVKWGLTAGFGYSLVQMALGADVVTAAFQPGYFGDGTMIGRALTMCLLDYVLAYTLLGLGGCFRNRIKSNGLSLMCGSLAAMGCRYLSHIFSGYILFSGWAEWFFTQEGFPAWGAGLVQSLSPDLLGWTYSIVYNGMYMIPEMVLTAAAALILGRMPEITRTKR